MRKYIDPSKITIVKAGDFAKSRANDVLRGLLEIHVEDPKTFKQARRLVASPDEPQKPLHSLSSTPRAWDPVAREIACA